MKKKKRKISYEPHKEIYLWHWNLFEDEVKAYLARRPKLDFYRFSCIYYDPYEKELYGEQENIYEPLTKEQYAYLLTRELYCPCSNFNDLMYEKPAFAKELLHRMFKGRILPSIILFDEVYEDAKKIENLRPSLGDLYKKNYANGLAELVVTVQTNKAHKLTITRKEFNDWNTINCHCVRTQTEGINGKTVRKLFGGKNDKEMIANIRERFHEATAFEDLIGYLKAHRVKVNEPVKYVDMNPRECR